MSRKGAFAALVALAAAAVTALSDDAALRRVYANEFPGGPGKDLAERWCLMCHSATLVTQQAKDSTGWEKTLGQMEKWGVRLAPEERDTLRAYLLTHYGPRKPGP